MNRFRNILLSLFFLVVLNTAEWGFCQNSAYPPLSAPTESTVSNVNSGSPSGLWIFVNVLGSLAMVIGLFCLLIWILRKTQTGAGKQLPSTVIGLWGQSVLAGSSVFLISIGKKLILVANSSTGLRTLCEITDESEIEKIRLECASGNQDSPISIFARFKQNLRQEKQSEANG